MRSPASWAGKCRCSSATSAARLHWCGTAHCALAVSSERRNALLPDVPTMMESGVPDYVVLTYIGVVAPAGTPEGIIGKLNAAINESLSSPEVAAAFAKLGAEVQPGAPQAFGAFLAAETQKWSTVARTASIKVE